MRASLLASATTATLGCARASSLCSQRPSLVVCSLSRPITARAPCTSRYRRYLLPRLVIPSSFGLPPVVAWRGTSPSQAEKSRPPRKPSAVLTAATRAVAVSGPIPGTSAPRRLVLARGAGQFMIKRPDASVEPAPLGLQFLDQEENTGPQSACLLRQDVRQGLDQLGLATRDSDPRAPEGSHAVD